MYEAIEHWKQYKQEKEKRAMKMTPFLIKLIKEELKSKLCTKQQKYYQMQQQSGGQCLQ